MPPKYTPEQCIAAFWNKSDKSGGADACWLWKARCNLKGYGVVRWKDRTQQAHRVAYLLAHDIWAGELMVLHTCDNPKCVNPKHLFLGTVVDNARDCVSKGRQARGERNGQHKLTTEQVMDIRRLNSTGIMQKDLATQYGVSRHVIHCIIRRLTWTWLD